MRSLAIIVIALCVATGAVTAEPKQERPSKVTIVFMEEPDVVRDISNFSLLRFVREEKFQEQGFKRVTVRRKSGQNFLLILSELNSRDFILSDGDRILPIYEL